MSRRNINVYINKDLLETAAVLFEDYPQLYTLLAHHAIVHIDLTDKELDDALSDYESDLALFQREYDIDLVPSHSAFQKIKENSDSLAQLYRVILFLNVNEEEARSLSDEYGLIISPQSLQSDISFFPAPLQIGLSAGDCVERGKNGWNSILSRAQLLPRSSVIINDRHLFDNEFGEVGYKNLLAALKALLPKHFHGTFQITIVSRYPNIGDEKCNQLGGKLKAGLNASFDYDISLEVFFINDTIHKRRIYLGYQTLKCDKGFAVFKTPHLDVIREDNEFELVPAFSLSGQSIGDSQFSIDSDDLSKILKHCQKDGLRYKAKKDKKMNDNIQLVGDYDKKTYSPSNRLFNV